MRCGLAFHSSDLKRFLPSRHYLPESRVKGRRTKVLHQLMEEVTTDARLGVWLASNRSQRHLVVRCPQALARRRACRQITNGASAPVRFCALPGALHLPFDRRGTLVLFDAAAAAAGSTDFALRLARPADRQHPRRRAHDGAHRSSRRIGLVSRRTVPSSRVRAAASRARGLERPSSEPVRTGHGSKRLLVCKEGGVRWSDVHREVRN